MRYPRTNYDTIIGSVAAVYILAKFTLQNEIVSREGGAQVSHNIPRDLPTSHADYQDVNIRIVPGSRCCRE